MLHWGKRVVENVTRFGPLVLGIDPSVDHVPIALQHGTKHFVEYFSEVLLNAAQGKIGFVKFQSAYFEQFGSQGMAGLAAAISMARERGFAIILDAKRGDIGSTADAYARAFLTPKKHGGSDLEVDCMTVNPFLGPETVEPFVECGRRFGKGIFVLVKTSNRGSAWLQNRCIGDEPVSNVVADSVSAWASQTLAKNGIAAVGAVVGATFPEQAEQLRRRMPSSVFLMPGVGAQGAQVNSLASASLNTAPILVPVSRGIAAVDEPTMPIEKYRDILTARIASFADSLRLQSATVF
jgi:orotidine-5'-phosphate decarboxylase